MNSIENNGDANRAALNGADPVFVTRARAVGRVAVYIAFALALTIPASLLLHYPILRPNLPILTGAHSIGAAFSLLLPLSVITLYINSSKGTIAPIRFGKTIWYIIIACSGIVLLEYSTPGELSFANYIRLLDPAEDSNKIAPNGALCLFATSLGALLISSQNLKWRRIGQKIAVIPAVVAALAIIGHAYSIESLYDISDYSQMSVIGAVKYLLLSTAMLCVRPAEGMIRILVMDSPAGVMSRRLYLAAILVPPVLGLFALVSAGRWMWYDISFGIVLFVVASILLFATVVAVTSLRIERADLFRIRAEDDLRTTSEQLRELSAHIQDMQEEERVRIAREVHDELGQSLTALKMDVSMLRNQLGARMTYHPRIVPMHEDDEVERRLNGMLELVNGTIRSVQRISSELRPSILDDLGLSAAIEWQASEFEKRSGIRCTLDLPAKDLEIDNAQSTAIFRIFQETLTNVARHAGAREIEIQLRESKNGHVGQFVQLRVHDDGIGLGLVRTNGHSEPNYSQDRPSGMGLMGMRERAALAGGIVEIESSPGEGMTVIVTMPSA